MELLKNEILCIEAFIAEAVTKLMDLPNKKMRKYERKTYANSVYQGNDDKFIVRFVIDIFP